MIDATAIVLAGGKSRRMGRDKSLMDIDGEPLIARVVRQLRPHFKTIIIGAANDGKYDFLGLRIVPDTMPDVGPLMGIASTLKASEDDHNFIMACDIPEVDIDLMNALMIAVADGDCAIPRHENGMFEPLFGVYRKSVLPHATAVLESGGRRIAAIFDTIDVRFVELDESGSCVNLNTEEDLAKWKGEHDDNL